MGRASVGAAFAHILARKCWVAKANNLPRAAGLRAAPGSPTRAGVARVGVEAKRSAIRNGFRYERTYERHQTQHQVQRSEFPGLHKSRRVAEHAALTRHGSGYSHRD